MPEDVRRAVVVGLGSMGRRRVRNLQANGVGAVTGVDLRADRRDRARGEYGIEVFESLAEALSFDPDAVVISLPPDLHMRFALEAVRSRRHVFVETGTQLRGLDELIDETRAHGVVAFPSATMTYFAGPRRVRELLGRGAIGRPLLWTYHCGMYLPDWHPWESIDDFYVSKRETGGCRELVPFEIAWLCRTFGRIASLSAQVGKVSDLPCDIDDVYQLLVAHEEGVRGSLTVDVIARAPVRHLRVLGSAGTIEWSHAEHLVRVFDAGSRRWIEETLPAGNPERGYLHAEEPYVEEMRTFLTCVRDGHAPPFDLQHRREILRWVHRAEESSRIGTRIEMGSTVPAG